MARKTEWRGNWDRYQKWRCKHGINGKKNRQKKGQRKPFDVKQGTDIGLGGLVLKKTNDAEKKTYFKTGTVG